MDGAERDLGVRFHPDYRRFQLEVSDLSAGVLEPATVLPDEVPYLNLRTTAKHARAAGCPRDVVPFCQDNGDYFYIDGDGRVGVWDHNARAAIPLRKSLAEWIIDDWLSSYGEQD